MRNQLIDAVKRVTGVDAEEPIDSSSIRFIIEFDESEKHSPKTNFDEMMYHWALPKKLYKELELEVVCESLVTGQNDMPL